MPWVQQRTHAANSGAAMRSTQLQSLTWGTVTAAVGCAVWLSSTDQAALFCSVGYRATSQAMGLEIPAEPTRAGVPAKLPGSSAARQLQAQAG
jgi:hypothetical protein